MNKCNTICTKSSRRLKRVPLTFLKWSTDGTQVKESVICTVRETNSFLQETCFRLAPCQEIIMRYYIVKYLRLISSKTSHFIQTSVHCTAYIAIAISARLQRATQIPQHGGINHNPGLIVYYPDLYTLRSINQASKTPQPYRIRFWSNRC